MYGIFLNLIMALGRGQPRPEYLPTWRDSSRSYALPFVPLF
jgi:hypothetical protein